MAELTGFGVMPWQLHGAAAELGEVADGLAARLDGLAVEVGSLLDGGWRGEAAAAFGAGWQRWRAAADDAVDGLTAMARVLESTGAGYATAEADSAHAVGGVA